MWQFQLYATVVFIVGSFGKTDWLYAIFVFAKKAVLSHVWFKAKKQVLWPSENQHLPADTTWGGVCNTRNSLCIWYGKVTLMTWAVT